MGTIPGVSPCVDDSDCGGDNIVVYVSLQFLVTAPSLTTYIAALLLAGCSSSSPLIPDIFLLSLYYQRYTAVPDTAQVDYNVNNAIANIVGGARLQARVGFFGICVSPDGGSWLCSNNATTLANEVSFDQDPLNLIWLASQFKDMIVFPYLL
jgi:hypothetical protein